MGGPNVRGWNYPGGPPPPRPHCLLPAHPSRPGKSGSVEHDGLGILVCHLSHVTQDIFFCDNTKQPPVGRDRAETVKREKRAAPLNYGNENNVRLLVDAKAETEIHGNSEWELLSLLCPIIILKKASLKALWI